MSEDSSKHVQTELPSDEYEAFREFARERGPTVKGAGRETLLAWMDVLDELEDDTLPASAETDARREADLVDEWNGDDAAFTLAVDPPVQP